MFGLVAGTAAGALAHGLHVAGAGARDRGRVRRARRRRSRCRSSPTSCPPARRGRAMGAVMGAFSVASVLGVPLGLRLARLGGWRLPFLAVAALGVVVGVLGAAARCRRMRGHIAPPRRGARPSLLGAARRRDDPPGARDERAGDADGVPGHPQHRRPPAAEPRLPAQPARARSTWSAARRASSSCGSPGAASTASAPRASPPSARRS